MSWITSVIGSVERMVIGGIRDIVDPRACLLCHRWMKIREITTRDLPTAEDTAAIVVIRLMFLVDHDVGAAIMTAVVERIVITATTITPRIPSLNCQCRITRMSVTTAATTITIIHIVDMAAGDEGMAAED